jgi:hypothetical protein
MEVICNLKPEGRRKEWALTTGKCVANNSAGNRTGPVLGTVSSPLNQQQKYISISLLINFQYMLIT